MFFNICYKKFRLYIINNELEFIKYFIKYNSTPNNIIKNKYE